MGGQVLNLFVIMAIGVILADMIHNSGGTTALFNGMSGMWKVGVNGMLGKTS